MTALDVNRLAGALEEGGHFRLQVLIACVIPADVLADHVFPEEVQARHVGPEADLRRINFDDDLGKRGDQGFLARGQLVERPGGGQALAEEAHLLPPGNHRRGQPDGGQNGDDDRHLSQEPFPGRGVELIGVDLGDQEPGRAGNAAEAGNHRIPAVVDSPDEALPPLDGLSENRIVPEGNSDGKGVVLPEAVLVEENRIVAVPADEMSFGRSAGRGPAGEVGIEVHPRIQAESEHAFDVRTDAVLENRNQEAEERLAFGFVHEKIDDLGLSREKNVREPPFDGGRDAGKAGRDREKSRSLAVEELDPVIDAAGLEFFHPSGELPAGTIVVGRFEHSSGQDRDKDVFVQEKRVGQAFRPPSGQLLGLQVGDRNQLVLDFDFEFF